MPHVEITMVEGRSIDQKRRIATLITDIIVEEAKSRREDVTVAFLDVKREDFAHGGTLVADMKR